MRKKKSKKKRYKKFEFIDRYYNRLEKESEKTGLVKNIFKVY